VNQGEHIDAEQVFPAAQALPQLPQFLASVAVSMHWPRQQATGQGIGGCHWPIAAHV
jgi:hypothetical protein